MSRVGRPGAQSVVRVNGVEGLAELVAADKRERDALAADVATAVEADLFITERPYLFGARKIHVPA